MQETPGPVLTGAVASLRSVSKVYGSDATQVIALDNVSVDFEQGSFTAIMGPSGSGKSTLLHCLAALDSPTHGQIVIAGSDISRLGDKHLTRLRQTNLGFVFQAFNLIPTLTARENILLPLQLARVSWNKTYQTYFQQLVTVLDIKDRLKHLPGELSGGQQQRVAIARALMTSPRIVVADEPTGNLDTKTSRSILEFLRSVADNNQQTIIMVTHDIQSASYAHEVIFLKDGRIVDKLVKPTTTSILGKLNVLEG